MFSPLSRFFISTLLFKQEKAGGNLGRGKERKQNTFLFYHVFSRLCGAVLTETASFTSPLRRNSVVYKIEPAQKLRETRDDGSVARGVVIQFKQWRGYQLIILRDCKQGFLLKLNQKQLLMFLRLCNMRRNIWILRRFKIWSPPVTNAVINDPVLQDSILTT